MAAHVLLVEDSSLVVGALRLLLEETGHCVAAAGTVRDAVAVARRERPDVVLLDLTLPDGDGLTVLHALTASEAVPLVAVAVTGHDDPRVRERCLSAGCRAVLLKPISARELPRQIDQWLADARAERAARSGS